MEELEKLKKELLKDEEIKEFVFKNKIDASTFNDNLGRFLTQYNNNLKCKKCQGQMDCIMDVEGMQTFLDVYRGRIELKYKPCPHYNKTKNYLELLHFPVKDLNNQEVFNLPSRSEVLKHMVNFQKNYVKGQFTKGIYIHGSFGTGKSFMLLKFANTLASKQIKVIFAYYPDLVRHLKNSIGDGTLEEQMNKLKTVDVLMLDDVGAESNSAFIRDEVLGAILNYRMLGNLPVFMSSNCSIDTLRTHFMESSTDVSKINSDRIIERIRYMMNFVELKDKNHRL